MTNSIDLTNIFNKCQVAMVFGLGNGSNELGRIFVVHCHHHRLVGEEGWRIFFV
jgi:hypothetical protein